eukprot:Hpha_TRINITY_DN10013_c0_g1::TRINITY_DN10013_c0_g1_i1::g.84105::m.84105
MLCTGLVIAVVSGSWEWERVSGWMPLEPWTEPTSQCQSNFGAAFRAVPTPVHAHGCLNEPLPTPSASASMDFIGSCSEFCVISTSLPDRLVSNRITDKPLAIAVAGGQNGCSGWFHVVNNNLTGTSRVYQRPGRPDVPGTNEAGARVLWHDSTRWRCGSYVGATSQDWLRSNATTLGPHDLSVGWQLSSTASTEDTNLCVGPYDGVCTARLSVTAVYNSTSKSCTCHGVRQLATRTGAWNQTCDAGTVMYLPLGCRWTHAQACIDAPADSCLYLIRRGCCVDALGHFLPSAEKGSENPWWPLVMVCCSCLVIGCIVVALATHLRDHWNSSEQSEHARFVSAVAALVQGTSQEDLRRHVHTTVAAVMAQVPLVADTDEDQSCPICLETGKKGESTMSPEDREGLRYARRTLATALARQDADGQAGQGETEPAHDPDQRDASPPFGTGGHDSGLPECLIVDLRDGSERGWGKLPCGHEGHRSCLEDWFLRQAGGDTGRAADPTCPLCRAVLPDFAELFATVRNALLAEPMSDIPSAPQSRRPSPRASARPSPHGSLHGSAAGRESPVCSRPPSRAHTPALDHPPDHPRSGSPVGSQASGACIPVEDNDLVAPAV